MAAWGEDNIRLLPPLLSIIARWRPLAWFCHSGGSKVNLESTPSPAMSTIMVSSPSSCLVLKSLSGWLWPWISTLRMVFLVILAFYLVWENVLSRQHIPLIWILHHGCYATIQTKLSWWNLKIHWLIAAFKMSMLRNLKLLQFRESF